MTMANVDEMKSSKDPEVLRLLGVEGNQGAELGLSADWASVASDGDHCKPCPPVLPPECCCTCGEVTCPDKLRLLGVEGNRGAELGLSADWAYNIIKAVGSYGEIFERNIGVDTPIGLERGLNALWTDGGLQYSPPFR